MLKKIGVSVKKGIHILVGESFGKNESWAF